jgi:alanyl-tRNA synthetase
MTKKLYDIDSHLVEFEATVIDSYPFADSFATVLDQTAFFPEGGGQASDIGVIDEAKVYDVQIEDEVIYHYTTKQFEKGQKVKGKIDFARRFDYMQQHSGEHIVSGVAHSLYGCENVGFHLGEDIVTLDFDKPLNKEQILKIEQLANEAVFKNVKFNTYYPDENTLSTLNYRSKKELLGAIRIVEIEDTDMCACCAPHVKQAAEIGIIKLLDSEKLRGGVRIEMKCGKRALQDYNQKYDNVRKISGALAVKQNETALGVERLLENISDLKFKITGLKKQIIDSKVLSFENKVEKTAIFEDELEIKELQIYADALFKAYGGIRAVFSPCDNGFSFAICGESNALDVFFKDFKAEFTVKGGGRNGMVQGTVVAQKENIEKFFNL